MEGATVLPCFEGVGVVGAGVVGAGASDKKKLK